MPEVHPQLCHLLNGHFKYFSPSFYTGEKRGCSYYRSLLMFAVLQEALKVSSHLLLYTSHSDKHFPMSAL